MVKDSPIVWACAREPWQLFATLTFKNPVPPRSVSASMFMLLMRETAAHHAIHFDRVRWVLRSELGEVTGRFHYHALMSGLPPWGGSKSSRFFVKDRWEQIRRDRGSFAGVQGDHARVYQFDASLDGVAYILKGLERYQFQAEANAYELAKFGGTETVTFSKSFLRVSERRFNKELGHHRDVANGRNDLTAGADHSALDSERVQTGGPEPRLHETLTKPNPSETNSGGADLQTQVGGEVDSKRLCNSEAEWLCVPMKEWACVPASCPVVVRS